MQINITIEASSGAELRQALLELTGGGSLVATISGEQSALPALERKADLGETATAGTAQETAAETTKKRRTKAEIEAEKAVSENAPKQDVPPADGAQPQVGASEVAETKTETPAATEGEVDLKEVQTMAANWIRKGPVYKEKVMGFLNKYKTDPAAALRIQDLTPEQLAEFFEGIKTITE